eukprot:1777249-Alexandrium_andersonii.AAC.1
MAQGVDFAHSVDAWGLFADRARECLHSHLEETAARRLGGWRKRVQQIGPACRWAKRRALPRIIIDIGQGVVIGAQSCLEALQRRRRPLLEHEEKGPAAERVARYLRRYGSYFRGPCLAEWPET